MRVAILEDDPVHRDTLSAWLREAGHDVHAFPCGRDFIRSAGRESFDLYLLDWTLPDMTGHDVLRWAREDRGDDVPAIFTTARDAEEDVVAALSVGADDYIVKPMRRFETLSRIEAVMRRARPVAADPVLEVGAYRFDTATKAASCEGEPVALTEKEFDLAVFLFRNLGRLISRGHMLEAVWGRNPNVATRTVDTHISRVRAKLGLRPERGFRLSPTYNYGYRLERLEAPPVAAGDTDAAQSGQPPVAAHPEAHAARQQIDELQQELDKASRLLRHDQLTGLLSRRGLEELFDKEAARAARLARPLCLAVLDLDNFKQINDELGHKAGDEALRYCAEAIRRNLRPQDGAGRYGGEEFVIVYPETGLEQAATALDRLRRELADTAFRAGGQDMAITFSGGVTAWQAGESAEAVLERADEAMYRAKRAGKDRVIAVQAPAAVDEIG
jgi:diguanylate cyclase (GGDEF)-like protein